MTENISLKDEGEKKSLTEKRKFFFNRMLPGSIFADYLRNSIGAWLVSLSLFFNLVNWIVLKIFIKPFDLPIILHYNVYFGVDIMGDWKESFFSPILGLFLFLINFSLALFFYAKKERIASHLLMISAVLIQLGLLVYSMSLIIINY